MKIFLLLYIFVSIFCEYQKVPGGFVANKQCVTTLPDNAHVVRRKDHFEVWSNGKKRIDPICDDIKPLPQSNSWQAWTTVDYTAKAKQIDVFTSNMVLPKTPGDRSGEILYIFPALQNVDWIPLNGGPMPHPFDIIQPVLQYNYDGSDHWMLANWYVGDDHVYTSKYIYDIPEGAVIWGNMTKINDNTYNIFSSVNGKSTNMRVTSDHLKEQAWAYTTVEKYGGMTCKAFPRSDLVFKDMKMYVKGEQISYTWVAHPKNPCVTNIEIEGQEKTTFSFDHQ